MINARFPRHICRIHMNKLVGQVNAALSKGAIAVKRCPPAYVAPVAGADPVGSLPYVPEGESIDWRLAIRWPHDESGTRKRRTLRRLAILREYDA